MTPDQRPVFDSETGAGLVPTTALTGGEWNIIRVPASRYGTINRTVLRCLTPATTFAAGFFSKAVTTSTLDTLVGNPLTEDYGWDANAELLNWDPDDSSTEGLLQAWGDHFKAAGYFPLGDLETDPVTGKMDDGGSWDFVSDDSPHLWLAVFPADDCTLTGRLYVAPET